MKHNCEDIIQIGFIEGDIEVAEEVKIEPCDYFEITYSLAGTAVKVEDLAKKLDTYTKGKIGEGLAAALLEIQEGILIRVAQILDHDLIESGFLGRIDVKLSFPCDSNQSGGDMRWQFWLSSGDRRKDYSVSCDIIVCVGVYPNGEIEMFVMPSSVVEAFGLRKHIPIPLNWQRSKYAPWNYPRGGPLPEALLNYIEQEISGK